MLVAHVEQEGVWLVEGDMKKLAEALAALAAARGVAIRYGETVCGIAVERGRAAGWSSPAASDIWRPTRWW